MFEKTLTKDSYKLLCLLYEEYLQRHDTMSRQIAKTFNTIPDFIYEHIKKQDCYDCLYELKKNDLIKMYVDGEFILTNTAIVYMENRFKKGISELLSFLNIFKP